MISAIKEAVISSRSEEKSDRVGEKDAVLVQAGKSLYH